MGKMNLKKPKKKKKFKIRYLLYLGIIYLSFAFTFFYTMKDRPIVTNKEFINLLLQEGNLDSLPKYKVTSMVNSTVKFFLNIDLSNPTSILNINNYKYNKKKETPSNKEITIEHDDDYRDMEEVQEISKYMEDPNPVDLNNPIIYLYNSHQLENYSDVNLDIYGITPNVLMASYILKEKLNKLGIPTIVEDTDLTEFMRINNWGHADSYKASRLLIIDKKAKYPSLKYFIDIHRDSISKEASTVTIGGKNYAKILFVVGLDYDNYEPNLNLANNVNNIFDTKYQGLSRGVLKKSGKDVNGVYNQDMGSKSLLIEVGGQDNTIEEVFNTITAISEVISKYVGDNNE